MPELVRGDVVKLGRSAQELHDVLGTTVGDAVQVRQRSTGKTRFVKVGRCIVVKRADQPIGDCE